MHLRKLPVHREIVRIQHLALGVLERSEHLQINTHQARVDPVHTYTHVCVCVCVCVYLYVCLVRHMVHTTIPNLVLKVAKVSTDADKVAEGIADIKTEGD